MSSPTYPITGILKGLGPALKQVPLRQEVDAWYENPANAKQVNLFILALAKFQSMEVPERLSYYQVAGIHGQPYVPWDEDTTSKSEGVGYCTHNSILFPDWHRPYMLLFEQRIYEIMIKDIIPSFPSVQHISLIAAANSWRFPYWDWAGKRSGLLFAHYKLVPKIVIPEYHSVLLPTGPSTIPNPMHKFTTPLPMGQYGKYSLATIEGTPFGEFKATSKCPPPYGDDTKAQWISGVQNNEQIEANIRQHDWYQSSEEKQYTDDVGEAVYRMFSKDYFTDYDAFSSTRYTADQPKGTPPPDYLSCEAIHNNLHDWVGGDDNGHMEQVLVSAFDPIFWLHHANIDRLFAIWQALNPNSWFDDSSQQLSDDLGNWSTEPHTVVTPTTPLAPFHTDNQGTYFTSDTCRDWTKFGYSYPELQPWLPKYTVNGKFNQAAYIKDVSAQVTALYSNTRLLLFQAPHLQRPPAPGSETSGAPLAVKIEHDDYIVNVLYERFALGGSPFRIVIFIGENIQVGSVYNFSARPDEAGGTEGCGNCQSQQAVRALSKGQVHITNALLREVVDDQKELGSLGREEVEVYLKKHLNWKVTKTHGVVVPLESIPSLKVSLAVGTGIHYEDESKLSKYHNYTVLHNVTEGRPGGLNRADHF